MQIDDADIGGARVRRVFRSGNEMLKSGTMLSADEVLAIPAANRRALREAGFIEIFPRGPVQSVGTDDADSQMHIVHLGGGKYDVIAGKKLNADGPLSKEEAEELATRPLQ
ncbi:hypothetical protein [Bradyrhizobium sp. ORS 86]|uniref:hypothetical protein n=1 Tax=Bradyrhizobium sp. ORS 86 TaxID=1685970 RepID=UPI00388DD464